MIEYIKNNRLKVILKPSAKEDKIVGYDKDKDALLVKVKAKPQDNKANLSLIRLIKRKFKKRAMIIKGLKSKEKILEIY